MARVPQTLAELREQMKTWQRAEVTVNLSRKRSTYPAVGQVGRIFGKLDEKRGGEFIVVFEEPFITARGGYAQKKGSPLGRPVHLKRSEFKILDKGDWK